MRKQNKYSVRLVRCLLLTAMLGAAVVFEAAASEPVRSRKSAAAGKDAAGQNTPTLTIVRPSPTGTNWVLCSITYSEKIEKILRDIAEVHAACNDLFDKARHLIALAEVARKNGDQDAAINYLTEARNIMKSAQSQRNEIDQQTNIIIDYLQKEKKFVFLKFDAKRKVIPMGVKSILYVYAANPKANYVDNMIYVFDPAKGNQRWKIKLPR